MYCWFTIYSQVNNFISVLQKYKRKIYNLLLHVCKTLFCIHYSWHLFFPCLIYQYMYTYICYNTDMYYIAIMLIVCLIFFFCSCSCSSSFFFFLFFFSFFFFFFFFFFNGCDLLLINYPLSCKYPAITGTAGHCRTPVLKYWNMWNPLWQKEQTWAWCQSQIDRLHLFVRFECCSSFHGL